MFKAVQVDFKGEKLWGELVHRDRKTKLNVVFEQATNTHFLCDDAHITRREEFPAYNQLPNLYLQK